MTLLEKYAAEFGKDQALMIMEAAESHGSTTIAKTRGSDSFQWALVICIDFDCWTKKNFRRYHKIKPSKLRIENWVKEHAHLEDYDGDIPPISLFCGRYNEFMPEEVST